MNSESSISSTSGPLGPDAESISFTVDSALLRELGERLVGKPHIALAELVKNSYDADATEVAIRLAPDRIEISDNGSGMTFEEFRKFWMRVGGPQKQRQRVSRRFARPLTGSKGVGRLAVQFLGREIEIHTVSDQLADRELDAYVNWDQSVQSGDLTNAKAFYIKCDRREIFPGGAEHGTKVILTKLNEEWSADQLTDLAKEIWYLQPPFRFNPRVHADIAKQFRVDLRGQDPSLSEEFEARMTAYLGLWDARLVGELVQSEAAAGNRAVKVELTLEFADRPGEPRRTSYPIDDCPLHSVEYEIRVYSLTGRQRQGIKVGEARDYFRQFGGVHIYDAGFHLPYYGPETDWLGVEMDHSHRLSGSRLLPDAFQVPKGLNNLPTNSRLFGVVHVDTSLEGREAASRAHGSRGDTLEIQVTRDRLVDNRALSKLKEIVRWALDFYAMEQTRRKLAEALAKKPTEDTSEKVARVEEVLDRFEATMPHEVFQDLRSGVREALESAQTETEIVIQQIALLAPLATAGMCAVAYEHEVGRQFALLESIAGRLDKLLVREAKLRRELDAIAANVRAWIGRAKESRLIFTQLASPEYTVARSRYKARNVLEHVAGQLKPLLRDVAFDATLIEPIMRLPDGTFAEWSALFQNVLINASNAMLDSKERRAVVRSTSRGTERTLRFEDTGIGVDLSHSDELFEPFNRKMEISSQRRALGLGGSGLGLTIVRMIADNVHCRVRFTVPTRGFNTCFELSWKEGEA
jgi:signal transduction histidine kinase